MELTLRILSAPAVNYAVEELNAEAPRALGMRRVFAFPLWGTDAVRLQWLIGYAMLE